MKCSSWKDVLFACVCRKDKFVPTKLDVGDDGHVIALAVSALQYYIFSYQPKHPTMRMCHKYEIDFEGRTWRKRVMD
jgi:hypothetical protein